MRKIYINVHEHDYYMDSTGDGPELPLYKAVEVTPELEPAVGKELRWIPDDINNPEGSGHIEVYAPPLSVAKAEKKADIATARYEQEMGGFNLPPEQGGMFVRTDARNRTLLNAAAIRAAADPAYEVPNWKTAEGAFNTLTNSMILALDQAVRDFIAAQFAKEAELTAQIDSAKTPEEVRAITWT